MKLFYFDVKCIIILSCFRRSNTADNLLGQELGVMYKKPSNVSFPLESDISLYLFIYFGNTI